MNAPPDHFLCPISHQPMRDPVTIASGITFDRENIQAWFSTSYPATCPVTRQVIDNPHAMLDNAMLKSEIQRWQQGAQQRGIMPPTPREKLPTRYKTLNGLTRCAARGRQAPSDDDALTQSLSLVPQDSVKSLDHGIPSLQGTPITSPFYAAGTVLPSIAVPPTRAEHEKQGRRTLRRQSSSYSRLQDVEALAARESSSRELASKLRRRSFDSASCEAQSSERVSGVRLGTGLLDDFTVNTCLDQCLAYFALLDLTGDGFISTRDMARAQRSSLVELQMPPPVHAAVIGRFGALDANRDGLITRREFVSALGGVMAQQEGLDQSAITDCMLVELEKRYPHDDALLAQRLAKRAARGGSAMVHPAAMAHAPHAAAQPNVLSSMLQALVQLTSRMSQRQLTMVMHAVAYTALVLLIIAYMAPGAITAVFVSALSTTVNLSIRGLLVGLLMATVVAAGLRSGGGSNTRAGRGVAQRVQRRRG